ncbi:unnamed protein product [Rhizopus stolonifer]
MLETNKPFMFSSTSSNPNPNNNNNTNNSPANTTNELPSPASVLNKPMNLCYYREEEKEPYLSYQGQPARLNSAFSHPLPPPEEYTYKLNNNTNYTMLPISHYSSPSSSIIKHVKETASPLYSIKNTHSFDTDEDSWFETQFEGDLGDNKKAKKRKEMTAKMERLNTEFLEKKERLCNEKLVSIDKELKEAQKATHVSYLDGLSDLENTRQKMIDDGQLFKEYQKQMTDHQFETEIYQAEEEYLLETQEIREKLYNVLEEKRRKLKEDKDNCDLAYDAILDSQSRSNKRNLRRRGAENLDNKSNKKKQMNGPALVFKLKEDSINTDIQQMRNVSPRSFFL